MVVVTTFFFYLYPMLAINFNRWYNAQLATTVADRYAVAGMSFIFAADRIFIKRDAEYFLTTQGELSRYWDVIRQLDTLGITSRPNVPIEEEIPEFKPPADYTYNVDGLIFTFAQLSDLFTAVGKWNIIQQLAL